MEYRILDYEIKNKGRISDAIGVIFGLGIVRRSYILNLFGLATIDYIEYNFIIIIIFSVYIILKIFSVIFKFKLKIKLNHYLSFPLVSIIFWIFIFWKVSNILIFESLYNEFIGYDDKYYDIYYKDLRE